MPVVMHDGIPLFLNVNNTYTPPDKGYYISYLPYTSDYGSDTTALVRDDGIRLQKFLILNGFHMDEYKKLNSYEECVEYFKTHLDQKNRLSEDWDKEPTFVDGKLVLIQSDGL